MFIKKAIIAAYIKEFAGKVVCREVFIQKHPEGFEAVQACFGTYAEFLLAVEQNKPKVVKAPVVKTVKK